MKARFHKHTLQFKHPSGTSRGVLTDKDTYFLILEKDQKQGIGECGVLKGLSPDPLATYESVLQTLCDQLEADTFSADLLEAYPSIQTGLEMAQQSLRAQNPFLLYPSAFSQDNAPIAINGLIWMGDFNFMQSQIEMQLEKGFDCLKMKIGAIDFKKELALLEKIRTHFSPEQIELRVDANGAFSPDTALDKLQQLAAFELHSIEQPIAVGQWDLLKTLCQKTPLDIALDEELIGITDRAKKRKLLDTVAPQYIILKPSLIGGFQAAEEWISLAEERGIGWWVTSALESNVGLNAIAQWTATLNTSMPQGLGTGSLYTNNIPSPLMVKNGYLVHDNQTPWAFNF